MMLIFIYNAWAVPFCLAFPTELSYYYIDWALDCFLLLNLYLYFCKFAFVHEGELIDDINGVKQQYVHCYLKVDVLSSVPYDIIMFFFGHSDRKIMVMAVL